MRRKAVPYLATDGSGEEGYGDSAMTDDFRIRFLIVDDEQSIRRLCMTIGQSVGFDVAEAESAEAALAYLETDSPDIVLVDRMLPNMTGDEFLRQAKQMLPRTEFAMITGHGSIESAVEAMRLGAYDYITKPFGAGQLKLLLQRMKEKVRLVAENEYLKQVVSNEMELNVIDGSSAKIQDILRMISRLKDTRTPVLIMGESGTGKELVARAIHFRGSLAKRPFVAVDCGSLVPTLIESELFGYEKGAFTGAVKARTGLFQSANGGNLFLHENRRTAGPSSSTKSANCHKRCRPSYCAFCRKRKCGPSAAIRNLRWTCV